MADDARGRLEKERRMIGRADLALVARRVVHRDGADLAGLGNGRSPRRDVAGREPRGGVGRGGCALEPGADVVEHRRAAANDLGHRDEPADQAFDGDERDLVELDSDEVAVAVEHGRELHGISNGADGPRGSPAGFRCDPVIRSSAS